MTSLRTFAAILLTTTIARVTAADTPPFAAEQTVATTESIRDASRDESRLSYRMWTTMIGRTFKVPINFEWAYVEADGASVSLPKAEFRIEPGETLSQVLDRFCLVTDGQLQWGRIRGTICVWPSGKTGQIDSLLDTIISLKLNGVSTWDALLELSKTVSLSSGPERALVPEAHPMQDEYMPPAQLRDIKGITLELENVTAREALCAILAASPLRLEFTYWDSLRPDRPFRPMVSNISIWAYDESHTLMRDIPPRDQRRAIERGWYEPTEAIIESVRQVQPVEQTPR